MPIRVMLAAVAATGLLAACGGDPKATSADRQAASRKAMLDYAACMRKHGVPMQDPQFNADGGVVMKSGGPGNDKVSPQIQHAAQDACQHFMKAVKPPNLSPQREAEARRNALANSRCMRAHGVPNFPDPQFGSDGEVQLRIDKSSGVDPQSPAFQRAQKACAKYLPRGAVGG